MRTIKIIFGVILTYLFWGCEPEDEICYIDIPIKPVLIECNYLDTIFSDFNYLLIDKMNKSDYFYYIIINSKEELAAIHPFDFGIDCIDFSEYTLIGGTVLEEFYDSLSISLLMNINGYYYLNIYGNDYSIYNQSKNLYKWNLYPKLKEGIEIKVN